MQARANLMQMSWRSLLAALLAFAILAVFYITPLGRSWLATIDLPAIKLRYALRGPVEPDPQLRVVGITENTIAQFAAGGIYYPPLPRDWHATAIRRLADAGARIVVLDILFSEAGSWDEAEDTALRDAVTYCRECGCEVVLAAVVERMDLAAGAHVETLVKPAPVIMEADPHLGLSNTQQKLSFKLFELAGLTMELGDSGKMEMHTQAVEAFRVLCDKDKRDFDSELSRATISVVDRESGRSREFFHVNYFAKPEYFPGYSYDYIRLFPELWLENTDDQPENAGSLAFRGLTDDELADLTAIFSGTAVFIGSRAKADNDYFNTPYGQMFGVDTNAQAFDTLAQRRIVRSAAPLVVLVIMLTLAVAGSRIALAPRLGIGLAAGVGLLIVVTGSNMLLFRWASIELPFSALLLGALIPMTTCTVYRGVTQELERRRIRLIFGRYVSDHIVEQIIADPDLAGLGGIERTVAVLFNDIRDYSTITEHLSPQQIVEFLNIYLTAASEEVQSHGGFVDKYLGDGMMAFFGAPVPTKDPAGDAIQAALAMIHALHKQVHPQVEAMGVPRFKVGIGIHLGPAVMGNIGSERRHDYTLIGDAVNVASRVEAETKQCGWAVLVTRDAMVACQRKFDFELVGSRQVKGRKQPVEVYRVVDPTQPDLFRL
jgi:class 3 adenylate cyclase/CHASE2 domain-containing sensor protein